MERACGGISGKINGKHNRNTEGDGQNNQRQSRGFVQERAKQEPIK
jgi:hypothetical protein